MKNIVLSTVILLALSPLAQASARAVEYFRSENSKLVYSIFCTSPEQLQHIKRTTTFLGIAKNMEVSIDGAGTIKIESLYSSNGILKESKLFIQPGAGCSVGQYSE